MKLKDCNSGQIIIINLWAPVSILVLKDLYNKICCVFINSGNDNHMQLETFGKPGAHVSNLWLEKDVEVIGQL